MIRFARLPIGSRDDLADPRGLSSPLPDSKLFGDPVDVLRASAKLPNPLATSPFSRLQAKPAGMFELAYAGVQVQSPAFRIRQELRQETERADRYARVRRSRTVQLGVGRMTGWDWIKWGRTIRPADPFGVRGPVRTTRAPANRGVLAQQLEIPAATLDKLARTATASDTTVSASGDLPIGTPRTPQLTGPATSTRAPERTDDRFQLVYLGIAVLVVYLLTRSRT